jgi:hypothetical protein
MGPGTQYLSQYLSGKLILFLVVAVGMFHNDLRSHETPVSKISEKKAQQRGYDVAEVMRFLRRGYVESSRRNVQ